MGKPIISFCHIPIGKIKVSGNHSVRIIKSVLFNREIINSNPRCPADATRINNILTDNSCRYKCSLKILCVAFVWKFAPFAHIKAKRRISIYTQFLKFVSFLRSVIAVIRMNGKNIKHFHYHFISCQRCKIFGSFAEILSAFRSVKFDRHISQNYLLGKHAENLNKFLGFIVAALLPNKRTAPLPLRFINRADVLYRIALIEKMLCNIKNIINKLFVIHFRYIAGTVKKTSGSLTR